ncbi:uncharacterized protein [Leuresthes tenuis]|uniref:uncharacterized protein isoform X2 n=1 Tax=Leuresthes tenuis TaxID=355514 RepID=UPI003B505877
MSWFQSLRDDFTLRPFEDQHTRSDSAAMASGPPDLMSNQEPADVQEECSGKKKSKFKTFKKFFARKKRKEPSAAGADACLKASQSSDNVSKTSENNKLTRSEKEKGSGSKISLGSKALSHDSVFVSDSSDTNEAIEVSQDSINGKVKSLQMQLKQAIRLGSPPSLMCVKKTEDAGTMSEDDGLPCSPPEYTSLHTAMSRAQRNSSNSLHEMDSDDDQLSCAASSRAVSPLVVPGDFSQPASPFGCLDNSAAKHKLGLRHKAYNKRKPARRLADKVEGDSAVETLNNSIPEADPGSAEEQPRTEDVSGDQLKPKVEREEEEDDEEGEEKGQPQDSRTSLLRDKQKGEKGEDESEAEQDVSHGLDTSCPPEPSLSEEEVSDDQPLPSSKLSSRASSLDSPRATPEPPAGPREYLMDPLSVFHVAEDNAASDSSSGEEDVVQESRDEESSFLEEVLSSLKTPLASCSLETEDVVLELEEMEEKEKERVETEESVETEGKEDEAEEPVGYQAASSCSIQSEQTSEGEEGGVERPSLQEEVVAVGEEVKDGEEKVAENEEEDLVLEPFTQHSADEQEAEEIKPEEDNMLARPTISQERDEGEEEESEGEEMEQEKKPEMEEQRWEKREIADENNDEVNEEEAGDAKQEEESGNAGVIIPVSQDEEVQSNSLQEAEEDQVVGDASVCNTDDKIPTEVGDQVLSRGEEGQEEFNQNSGDEREDGEEEGKEADLMEENSEEENAEEEMEANQPEADHPERNLEQESYETLAHLDTKDMQKDPSEVAEQVTVSFKPSPLSLPESHDYSQSHESAVSSPSKTFALQINLTSPTSEKALSLFQPSSTAVEPSESVAESLSPGVESTEPDVVDEEHAGSVEDVEENPSDQEQEDSPPAAVEEALTPPPDKSKARFTIAPAWQRSQSLTPSSSPPADVTSSATFAKPGGDGVEAATEKEQVIKAEPQNLAKVDVVLSPDSVRAAESSTAKAQSDAAPVPVKAQSSAPAATTESSVVAEGNPDNPFGVRLRKTSALLRFSSEEENPEPPAESPSQLTTCKVDPPQPVSSKPTICQPISNKPALPKKPEVHVDAGGKLRHVSDPVAGRGVPGGADPPSWISVAKQKQKIYKENSLDEITVIKEDQERKSSLPTYVSSAASREQSNKTAQSTSKAGQSEISKPSVSVEKETRRALSPPTPVPPHPSKSQPLPCPVAPKPQMPPITAKPPPQPNSPQKSLSPPTPVPVPSKPAPSTTPSYLSKTATSPKTPPVTSPPFSSRISPEKPGSRSPGLPGQGVSSQRGLPPPALPQDEPPWMALAKKKAKAWSEMPQIVQ